MSRTLSFVCSLVLLQVYLLLQANIHTYAQVEKNATLTRLPNLTTASESENVTDAPETGSTQNISDIETATPAFNSTENSPTTSATNDTESSSALPTSTFPISTPGPSNYMPILLRDTGLPCGCDLTSTQCDVNCCCDKQCSSGDRLAFSGCSEPIPRFNSDYCFQENFVFLNNTRYIMVETSNNLFCIYRDNYEDRFQYKDVTTISDSNEVDKLIKKYQKFPWPEQNNFTPDFSSVPKVGTPIYVKFDSGYIGFLDISTNSISGECVATNPATYMRDEDNVCIHLISSLELECTKNSWLNGRTYFQGFTVARSPNVIKDSNNTSSDNFLEVTPELCQNVHGVQGKCNATDQSEIQLPSYDTATGTCKNAVMSAAYVISHNGTEGIIAVKVQLTLKSIRNKSTGLQSPATVLRWTQNHGAAYVWNIGTINKTNISVPETPIRYSGNPGYQTGAPVLAGKLISHDIGDSAAADVRQAVRLSQDSSDWLTVVGAVAGNEGRCLGVGSLASQGRLPVNFGENTQTGCSVTISLNNMTGICGYIQSTVMDILLGVEPPDVVGAYGNSKVENPGEWVPILRDNLPLPSRAIGNSACTNIVQDMSVHIVYANFGSFDHPQAKIVSVRVRLGAPGELSVRCVGRYCQDNADHLKQTLAVTSSVNFVDVSETAVPFYAENPTIRIELPSDFFYPFSSCSPMLPSKLYLNVFVTLVLAFLTCNVFQHPYQ